MSLGLIFKEIGRHDYTSLALLIKEALFLILANFYFICCFSFLMSFCDLAVVDILPFWADLLSLPASI